jgi:alpha-beta hydrolase superfamily lysophospholipase
MGNTNKSSNPIDFTFDTDYKKHWYVERFYRTTKNETVIKWKEYKFPITNPVNFVAKDGTKLATYKYPAAEGTQFKGVIFFIHGFQSNSNRNGHVAKSHSDLGYDFYSMDMRGHGSSDGQTILIPSVESTAKDFSQYHKMVLEKFYSDSDPPVFLMSSSYGGMVAMHILMNEPEIKYKAAHFISAFFGFHPSKKSEYSKLLPVAQTTCFLIPSATMPVKMY